VFVNGQGFKLVDWLRMGKNYIDTFGFYGSLIKNRQEFLKSMILKARIVLTLMTGCMMFI
jgi:hypothetical protein